MTERRERQVIVGKEGRESSLWLHCRGQHQHRCLRKKKEEWRKARRQRVCDWMQSRKQLCSPHRKSWKKRTLS
jgi:hypothetical protein